MKKKLYDRELNFFKEKKFTKFGPISNYKFFNDPQYLIFQLSRYKHICRLFDDKISCLEVGCGDGIGLPILSYYYKNVLATDISDKFIKYAKILNKYKKNIKYLNNDFVKGPIKFKTKYDIATCFDVISSISKKNEKIFIKNIIQNLKLDGSLIVGTMNKLSTSYSKKDSLLGQKNFKTYDEIKKLLSNFFKTVIVLSVNDETIHTGKRENANYFIAIGFIVK